MLITRRISLLKLDLVGSLLIFHGVREACCNRNPRVYYSPVFLQPGILMFSLIKYTRITYKDYGPPWGEAVGCIGVRAGGGLGGLQPPPPWQKFLNFFGQNADDSGKSIREKIILKLVKARLEGYFLCRLPCQDGVKVKWSNKDPGICVGKAIYRLHVYRRSPRDETRTDSKQTKTYKLGQNLLRHITRIPIFYPDKNAYSRKLKDRLPLPLLQCCLR